MHCYKVQLYLKYRFLDLLTKYALSTTTNVISSSQYLQSSITRGLSSTPSSSSSIAPSSPKSTGKLNFERM